MAATLSPRVPSTMFGRATVHVRPLLRLAAPVVVARAGVMAMAFVDTVMVGQYSAQDLAYLGIALAPITLLLLTSLGLVTGTLVLSAAAVGAGREGEAGLAWRRSLPYALTIGAIAAAICLFGETLLKTLGQSSALAGEGGNVVRILGIGLPAALVFLTTTFFLEGIRRPVPGMIMMIAANLLNLLLNWVLVYGNLGFLAMGAAGSAWATTVVRLALAIGLLSYVLSMPDRRQFGASLAGAGDWWPTPLQRRLGFAAGGAIGVEAASFATVNVFAGWLGALPLAAFAIGMNLLSLVLMVAVGLGTATSVRVGIAFGRKNPAELAWSGWTGLATNSVAMGGFALAFAFFPVVIASAYTEDPALAAIAGSIIAFCAWIVVTDGGQTVMAAALRGRGETWTPTMLQTISYIGVQIPLCWLLAFPLQRGVLGLFEGILVASLVAVVLLSGHFHRLGRRDATDSTEHKDIVSR